MQVVSKHASAVKIVARDRLTCDGRVSRARTVVCIVQQQHRWLQAIALLDGEEEYDIILFSVVFRLYYEPRPVALVHFTVTSLDFFFRSLAGTAAYSFLGSRISFGFGRNSLWVLVKLFGCHGLALTRWPVNETRIQFWAGRPPRGRYFVPARKTMTDFEMT